MSHRGTIVLEGRDPRTRAGRSSDQVVRCGPQDQTVRGSLLEGTIGTGELSILFCTVLKSILKVFADFRGESICRLSWEVFADFGGNNYTFLHERLPNLSNLKNKSFFHERLRILLV